MKKNLLDKKGFTLIELLVVIAIIGILSSIVIASLNNARNKAPDTALKRWMGEYASLYTKYYIEQNIIPVGTAVTHSNPVISDGTSFNIGYLSSDSSLFPAYKQQARDILKAVYDNSDTTAFTYWAGTTGVYIGSGNNITANESYFLLAKSKTGKFYCVNYKTASVFEVPSATSISACY